MAKVKMYEMQDLLNLVLEVANVSEDIWNKAQELYSKMSDLVGQKVIENYQDEWEAYLTIKQYKKLGFEFV